MNERQIYTDDYERMLDLRDLFYYLVKRWRSLIVMLVIGMLIGCVIGIWQNQPIAFNMMSDMDKAEVDQLFQYQLLYEDKLKYNKESLVMQLDGEAQYSQGGIVYYVYAGENTALLGSALDVTGQEGFLDGIRELVDYDVDDRYLKEIVCYSFELSTNNSITINNSGNNDNTYGTIHIWINYVDENICKKIIEYVETQMNALNEQCQQKYGDYTFEQTQRTITDAGNTEILEMQKDSLDSTAELLKSMSDLKDTFSESQLTYYNKVYLKEHTEDATENLISKKWTVIGGLLFVVFWGVYFVLFYIFSEMINTENVLKGEYGLNIIARFKNSENNKHKKNKIDLIIKNAEEKGMADTCNIEYIAQALDKLPEENILMCIGLVKDNGVLNQIIEKSCKNIKTGALLHTDTDTLKAAKESEGVVFLIELKETKRVHLEAELSVCKLYGIKVLGVISMWG